MYIYLVCHTNYRGSSYVTKWVITEFLGTVGIFLLALRLSFSFGKDNGRSINKHLFKIEKVKQNTPEYYRFKYAKKYPFLPCICSSSTENNNF